MRSFQTGMSAHFLINRSQFSERAGFFISEGASMNDSDFLHHFEKANLPSFRHYEHIRMAWLYLKRDGWEKGYQQIQQGIQHVAKKHGQIEKYHESITRFWALLVFHCIQEKPELENFDTFIRAFPFLLDKASISKHYSSERLFSPEARAAWLEPDLIPMP
jgi:hypothetical protein